MDGSGQPESLGVIQIILDEIASPERPVIPVVAERFCRTLEPGV
jgi:hypothetical protein